MNALFDTTVLLQGKEEICHANLPFLPRVGEQIKLSESVYIVTKVMYDLSVYQGSCILVIPATVFVRRKTDNDY